MNAPIKITEDATVQPIRREEAAWEKEVLQPALKLAPESQAEFRTGSDEFVVKRLYTQADLAGFDYLRDLGFPGQYPFTRGVMPAGYRNRGWRLGYYAGHGSSSDTNVHFRRMHAGGATYMHVAMDLPTQLGYDPDHPYALGEVGKVGVACTSLRDMEEIFAGIPLDKVGTGTVGNCIGYYTMSAFAAAGERAGIEPNSITVQLQNDPLKEYTGRGTYIFPVAIAVELAIDVVEHVHKYLPNWEPQYVCATQMRWGGATAAQEIGFGFANIVEYIDCAMRRGIKIEALIPRMNFHMTTDNDLFEEVAKFRAARRMWARLVKDRYGSTDPRVLGLRISTFTNGTRMTAQQPLNNVVRGTVHALASILGGTEKITVPAFDEALALPTMESIRLADLTKIILHHEHGLAGVVDPLAGSYYVEDLTNRVEDAASRYFATVQEMGGSVVAIENGYFGRQMAEGALRYQRSVESGERKVVGVNLFTEDKDIDVGLFEGNPAAEREQVDRVRSLRATRSADAVSRALDQIRRTAEAKVVDASVNIVPVVLDAVRLYATVGEITGVLRDVFGEYRGGTSL